MLSVCVNDVSEGVGCVDGGSMFLLSSSDKERSMNTKEVHAFNSSFRGLSATSSLLGNVGATRGAFYTICNVSVGFVMFPVTRYR